MISNITQILIENALKLQDKPAIIHKSQQISYKELVFDVKSIASYFQEKGIKKGDKVLIFVPMTIELYKILLAIFYLGATAVFLDAWSNKNRLEQAVKIADCSAFIGIPKAHILRLTSSEIRKLPLNFIAGFDKFRPKKSTEIIPDEVSLGDTALITFTTGSTGSPKAAKRTHGFLLEQHYTLVDHLKPEINDIDMATLPIFVLSNLASGITSIIPNFDPRKPENINPKIILNEINSYNINTTTGSPVFYEKLADYCILNKTNPTTLKKMFLGGAPVFPILAKKLNQAFSDTYVEIVYGSTEAEPISSISTNDLINFSGTIIKYGLNVGKPIDSINLKIIKIIDGSISANNLEYFEKLSLKFGEIGEICVSGNHVLKEYFNSDEAQKLNKINVNGTIWHRTGDAGYLDNKGNLFLMGRTKNKFSFKGQDYYVFPIENLLLEIPEIQLGTILKLNDKILFIIELKKQFRGQKNTVKDRIKDLDIPYSDILFINRIPRDPRHNSKIDYDKLKSML